MPRTTRELCQDSLALLIDRGCVKSFVASGRYRAPSVSRPLISPANALLMHYASCQGPLYRDEADWKFAADLVFSFTRRGQRELGSTFTLSRLFGLLHGVKAADLLSQLPFLFEQLGFRCQSRSEISRSGLFVSQDRCTVVDLPEPYGKWSQLRERRPRWDQEMELEVEATCSLSSPGPYVTHLDLTLSTLALPVVEDLADRLGRLLGARLSVPSVHSLLDQASESRGRLLPPRRGL